MKPQMDHQEEPFFLSEEVEAELIATGYEFEPPNHARTVHSSHMSQTNGSSMQ